MSVKHESINMDEMSPGEIFKRTRESKNISTAEVCQNLLLSKKIVTAIENDDYDKIPAQVYAEGYIKSYAQFLHLPAAKIISNFRKMNFYGKQEVLQKEPEIEPSLRVKQILEILKNKRIRLISGGVLAFLLLFIIVFAVSGNESTKNDNSSVLEVGGKIVSQLPVTSEVTPQVQSQPQPQPKTEAGQSTSIALPPELSNNKANSGA